MRRAFDPARDTVGSYHVASMFTAQIRAKAGQLLDDEALSEKTSASKGREI